MVSNVISVAVIEHFVFRVVDQKVAVLLFLDTLGEMSDPLEVFCETVSKERGSLRWNYVTAFKDFDPRPS